MKLNIATWTAAAAMTLSLASCGDSFLDREPGGTFISEGQMTEAMKWNTQIMLGELQGITSNLVAWQSGGTTNQDDFGQKSVDIATDLMSGDMVFSTAINYGWFGDDARLINGTASSNRSYVLWRYYYRIIHTANMLIDQAEGQEPENAQNKIYYAAAKTSRAHSYFNLIVNFAKNYDEAKLLKAIPVYDRQTETYGAPQTVDSVYNFVINDLLEACTAFDHAAAEGVAMSDISLPDKSVALTILAYTYLQKGDYPLALQAAQTAIENSPKQILPLNQVTWGFNSVNNSNWMWGVDVTDENAAGLPSFFGMMDYFTYSYQAAGDYKVCNAELFFQIPESDVRADWFSEFAWDVDEEGNYYIDPTYLLPTLKFYDAAREPMGDATWTNDALFMRIEEPYMIAAEAAARLGDTGTACTYLKAILDNRDAVKAEALANMTAEELLDELYFEWRLEFWGEGRSLLTLKRFKKDMMRPSNDYYSSLTKNGAIPYSDSRLYFAIPQKELESNPLMKDAHPLD